MSAALSRIESLKWNGSPVVAAKVPINKVHMLLPNFSRQPFVHDGNANENLETIVREPIGEDRRAVPVAVVSKRYALIQHRELVVQVVDALTGLDIEIDAEAEADVLLSEYSERFQCSVLFKHLSVDPGDGHPISIRLFLQNSVDGSCAFEISLRWFRQICSNGMTVLARQDRHRVIHHLDRASAVGLRAFLERRLPASIREASALSEWCRTPVSGTELRRWINDSVCKAWGPHAAARALHICSSGYDGRVGVGRAGKKAAEELFVSSDTKVPGAAAPATSVYQVFQALTWIASRRQTIEDREAWSTDALRLARLLASRVKKS